MKTKVILILFLITVSIVAFGQEPLKTLMGTGIGREAVRDTLFKYKTTPVLLRAIYEDRILVPDPVIIMETPVKMPAETIPGGETIVEKDSVGNAIHSYDLPYTMVSDQVAEGGHRTLSVLDGQPANDSRNSNLTWDGNPIQLTNTAPGPAGSGVRLKTGSPDLIPYKPSGWSDKIVVSKVTGSNTDDFPLLETDELYIDWAVLNQGTQATAATFYIALYVDDVLKGTWSKGPPLNANTYTWYADWHLDPLTAGAHTLKIVADNTKVIPESNEANNEYSRTIIISPPDLTPYQPTGWDSKIVISNKTGTHTNDSPLYVTNNLYIDWAVLNQGGTATSARFYTALYIDGVYKYQWYTDPPMTADHWVYTQDYNIGTLTAGTHSVKITTDYKEEITESNETNNSYTRYITVLTTDPDLVPYQPTGWSSKIVVSNKTGTHTDDSPLYQTDNIYVDWAVQNQGPTATAVTFHTTLYVDGVQKGYWYTGAPMNPNSWAYVGDFSIGTLSVGNHTLKITVDSQGEIIESIENNNDYTRTITISPPPPDLTPYKPSGWSDKIVTSIITGTNTDAPTIYPTDNIYIDYAVLNQGSSATSGAFYIALFIDGIQKATWTRSSSLSLNTYYTVQDYNIGSLGAGTHTLKIVVDNTGTIDESNETNNDYTKTITVSATPPDLVPFQPSGWSDKIVVSKTTGNHTDDSPYYTTDNLYVDWSVTNQGGTATAVRFFSALYLDGVLKNTWYTDPPLNPTAYVYGSDYSLGSLAAGTHTLKIVVDYTGTVSEGSETNNEYTKTINVITSPPDLTPYKPSGWTDKIVASTVTGTTTDAVSFTSTDNIYIDWAIINQGATATAARFYVALYIDGVQKNTWFKDPPLNINTYLYLLDYNIGTLAAGIHTVKIVADNTETIAESDEKNNEFTKTITVGAVLPDLIPYTPRGWSDKIVVSKETGNNTDDSPIYPTDNLYVDWSVVNNGGPTGASFTSRLYLDGALLNTIWTTPSPMNAGTSYDVLDYNLGTLAAGTHTLRLVVDFDRTITESNESNNEYTKTFTVVSPGFPDLTPYKPSSWDDKIVVSTGTGTNSDAATIDPSDNIYIDWAVINQGAAAASDQFGTALYVDGNLFMTWYTNPPFNVSNWAFIVDYNIGTLAAGNHIVKIVADNTGKITESDEGNNEYTKTFTVSSGGNNHFKPVWTGSPVNPMTITVKMAELDGDALDAGDEIGVFDGSLCVGMGKLTTQINPNFTGTYLQIIASQDTGSGNGYTTGHTITYKYWMNGTSEEIDGITAQYNAGPPNNSPVFSPGQTTIAELSANPGALMVRVETVNPSCFGSSTGQITVLASGGTTPYFYSMDNGINWQSDGNFSFLRADEYYIRVKDSRSPSPRQSEYPLNPVILVQPPELVVTRVISENVTGCYDDMNGTITIHASGGTGSLRYSIDGGRTWQNWGFYTKLGAGPYNIQVQDDNNCIVYFQDNPVVIHHPDEIVIEKVIAEGPWPGRENEGKITILAKGGTGTLRYSIDNGNLWSVKNVFANLGYVTFNEGDIQVKDDNDCIKKFELKIVMSIPDDFNLPGLKVYPNPARDLLHLSVEAVKEDCTVQIINYAGQVVYSGHLKFLRFNEVKTIHIENLEDGFYTLVIRDENDLPVYRNFVIIR